jgi:hypothetical protein
MFMKSGLRLKLNWIMAVPLMVCIGCQSFNENNPKTIAKLELNSPGNEVTCISSFYFGLFGDGQREWSGMFYLKQNLSVVIHLPTKSEFFIYVRALPSEENITNGLKAIASELQGHSGAKENTESWETLTQKVHGYGQDKLVDFHYLRSEFSGTRIDTDAYSKTDHVETVVYATPFLVKTKAGKKTVCFICVTMIPVEVSAEERQRLLGVLKDFLQHKLTLFES